jgi:50S ribosomal protein L16 3-hydroxylase
MSPRAKRKGTGSPAPGARPGAPSLHTLFAPLRAVDFIERYWPTRPLVRHRPLERLGALVDLDEFSDFRRWPRDRKLSISATLARTGYQKLRVDPEQAAALFAAGATLSFNGVHTWHPTLRKWVRALAAELGLPSELCHANVYVSPAGEGVPKHFDAHSVIAVQLIGHKSWLIAPNRDVVHPLENYVATRASVLERGHGTVSLAMPRGSTRCDLRPGSVIFLPAGFWHATRAREASLSVTFGLRAPRWLDLLRDALMARLAESADWREPAFGVRGSKDERAAARTRLASMLADLPHTIAQLNAASVLRGAGPRAAPRATPPASPRAGRAARRARSR